MGKGSHFGDADRDSGDVGIMSNQRPPVGGKYLIFFMSFLYIYPIFS